MSDDEMLQLALSCVCYTNFSVDDNITMRVRGTTKPRREQIEPTFLTFLPDQTSPVTNKISQIVMMDWDWDIKLENK